VGPGADGVPLLSCMDLGTAGAAEQQLRSQAKANAETVSGNAASRCRRAVPFRPASGWS
jgi:hypothetical protein